ncbi:hypothetical protein EMIT093MI4_100183 [Pseudomonas sp. IT-93MI4]
MGNTDEIRPVHFGNIWHSGCYMQKAQA